MKKFALAIVLASMAASPAFAQNNASAATDSLAVASPSNIGNPVINMAAANPFSFTSALQRIETNQASPGPSVFVNPPAADTCDRAGVGISGGWVTGNAGVNIPRGQSDKCDMRADSINLKVIGAPPEVIKARHCMDANMAEAYARAGVPCRDMRPEAQQQVAQAPSSTVLSSDPLIRARQLGQ